MAATHGEEQQRATNMKNNHVLRSSLTLFAFNVTSLCTWARGVLAACVHELPISGGCGRPAAPGCLQAAICQLTLKRRGNQNALQRVQSVPPQVGLWEGRRRSTHSLSFDFLPSNPSFCDIIVSSLVGVDLLFGPRHGYMKPSLY